LHDEAEIYERELEEAQHAQATVRAGLDWYSFTLAFKGVFLEGLEVAFIVVTFGAHRSMKTAIGGAVVALVIVAIVGALVHRPLTRVPENTMKFAVGLMLASFGMFWGAEGVGVEWPGHELALAGVLVYMVLTSVVLVAVLRRRHAVVATPAAVPESDFDLRALDELIEPDGQST
jgi:uncharacterized membrane protein